MSDVYVQIKPASPSVYFNKLKMFLETRLLRRTTISGCEYFGRCLYVSVPLIQMQMCIVETKMQVESSKVGVVEILSK